MPVNKLKIMKQVSLLSMILMLASGVFSQNTVDLNAFQWRVFGGVNYAIPMGEGVDDLKDDIEDDIEDYEDDDRYDMDIAKGGVYGRTGFHLGLSVDYALSDLLGVYSSLSYSQKGWTESTHYEGTYEEDYYYSGPIDFMTINEMKVNLNYLDLPIGMRYKISENVHVFGGLLVSFLLSDDDNVEYEYEYEYDGSSYGDDDEEDFEDYFGEDPEKRLSGIQLGIDYIKGNKSISLKMNKNSSFGEVNYSDNNDDWSNLTFQVSAGISL